MPTTKIGIFGYKDDKQSRAFAEAAREVGGDPLILDMRLGAGAAERVTLGQGKAFWDGQDCLEIESYYIRATAPNTWPSLPPVLNQESSAEFGIGYLKEQQFQAFSYSFFDCLSDQGKLVVNSPSKYIHHDCKAQFYETLRSNGFAVPETLTTNESKRFSSFIAHKGKVVVKPSIGVGSTRLVYEFQQNRLDEVELCPIMMQEFKEGNTVRVHVVGDTMVLALKIMGDQIDSRTLPEGFEFLRMSREASAEMVKATRFLGLHFAAWDIILSPEGRPIMLDCNPGPYVMWIGAENVSAIYRQLATYLITYANSKSIEEASASVRSVEAPRSV